MKHFRSILALAAIACLTMLMPAAHATPFAPEIVSAFADADETALPSELSSAVVADRLDTLHFVLGHCSTGAPELERAPSPINEPVSGWIHVDPGRMPAS